MSEAILDEPAPKKKSMFGDLSPIVKLLPFVWVQKTYVFGALIFLTIAAGATLVLPKLVGDLIESGFSAEVIETINVRFLAFLLLATVMAVSSAFRYYFVMSIGERVVADLRAKFYEQLLRLDQKFYQQNLTGDLLSRLSSDTTSIKSAVGVSVSMVLRNGFIMVGAVIMMFTTSWYLSLMVVAAIPLMIIPLVLMGGRVRVLAKDAQTTFAETTAYAGETLSGIHTVQSFTYEKQAGKNFRASVDTALVVATTRIKAQARLISISIFMVFASIVGIMWMGANAVLDGSLGIADLSEFVIYAVLAASSLAAISQVWGEIQQMAGASERIMQLLDMTPAITSPKNPIKLTKKVEGHVEFNNVEFSYGEKEVQLFKGLNFSVKPGEMVAFVGPSGAGKSTIFNLLMRFYDINAGQISLDNQPIANFDPADLRNQFATVPQEVMIFANSAMENIRFGRIEATDEEVIEAAKAAEAHDFIMRTSDGYNTALGERGMALSGGQRQRIAIARAILRNAPVLLLDEATSALDSQSEKKVQRALENLAKGRTTLIVAHRLSTIRDADRILVIDEGEIVEQGDHQQLMKKNGTYAKLVQLQTQDIMAAT
ncbi:MAG: ABC transporter transmembrane domain-containing protein [Hyphomicrobiales bacterium]|nr:ABC transporter transmembrane domain-containing protein [Hyphomicrobiales bacterium]